MPRCVTCVKNINVYTYNIGSSLIFHSRVLLVLQAILLVSLLMGRCHAC